MNWKFHDVIEFLFAVVGFMMRAYLQKNTEK